MIWVYPRWRGEHVRQSLHDERGKGLSPLARGTLIVERKRNRKTRFIPAGAGNTTASVQVQNPVSVYPRWRGEHAGQSMWYERDRRFIPAGAGNTGCLKVPRDIPPVYPRWRGEHEAKQSNTVIITGLSPLARGTLRNLTRARSLFRFIPAGAGNTNGYDRLLYRNSVYPRWRGEHFGQKEAPVSHAGLSPLARGTRWHSRNGLKSIRFIPAGAGNT